MAAARVTGHVTIDSLIERAKALGMKYEAPPVGLVDQDGTISAVRYLINPNTGARFMLTQFEDGEIVSPAIADAMQRRLGITFTNH